MKDRQPDKKLSKDQATRARPRSPRLNLSRRRLLWVVPVALSAGVVSMAAEIMMSKTTSAGDKAALPGTPNIPWRIGMLRDNGLRIVPTGRTDASHVLNPEQFSDAATRHAYWVATQIPATLNQLYCWCGCENRGEHRSNLQCFEDQMAVTCPVCQGTAEIAYQMTRQGIKDPGKIQAAVDAKWAPKG
jgi:Protein of unknown function with PCYCGC motif